MLFKKKAQNSAVSQSNVSNNEMANEVQTAPAKEVKEPSPLSLKSQFKTKKGRTRFLTRVGMFSALALVFYAYIKFPLPFFPSFLEVKFHNLFVIIGALSTGPVGGLIITTVMVLLKIVLVPSTTGYVGELNDFFLTILIMLPASLIYFKHHNKTGGAIGIGASLVSWIVFSFLLNWLVTMPFYINFYFGGSIDALVSVLSKTLPSVTTANFMKVYLFGAVLPFNALVGFVNCGLAFLVYKKISVLLKKIGI